MSKKSNENIIKFLSLSLSLSLALFLSLLDKNIKRGKPLAAKCNVINQNSRIIRNGPGGLFTLGKIKVHTGYVRLLLKMWFYFCNYDTIGCL